MSSKCCACAWLATCSDIILISIEITILDLSFFIHFLYFDRMFFALFISYSACSIVQISLKCISATCFVNINRAFNNIRNSIFFVFFIENSKIFGRLTRRLRRGPSMQNILNLLLATFIYFCKT